MVNETGRFITGLLTPGNFYSHQYFLVILAHKNMAGDINIFPSLPFFEVLIFF